MSAVPLFATPVVLSADDINGLLATASRVGFLSAQPTTTVAASPADAEPLLLLVQVDLGDGMFGCMAVGYETHADRDGAWFDQVTDDPQRADTWDRDVDYVDVPTPLSMDDVVAFMDELDDLPTFDEDDRYY